VPTLFWTGKLSPPVKALMNINCLMARILGSDRDTGAMKERIRSAYDGVFTEYVKRYDELGLSNQLKAAREQAKDLDVIDKEVLDIGAGTGALSFMLLENGAKKVTCGDISQYMLDQCCRKALDADINETRIDFKLLDAEALPYADNSFDVAVTGMSFGLFPNQQKAVEEMVRVVKPGGLVSLGAHGPEHYWESLDGFIKSTNIFYIMGYRPEYWPRTEAEVRKMMAKAGLQDIITRRVTWKTDYASGGEALDFFAAITSSFQYSKYPAEKRQKDYQRVRNYFNRKNLNYVTDDIILATGRKQL
jgi:ubiquinone/menaquinone biosynthesis C-methylase UbiE